MQRFIRDDCYTKFRGRRVRVLSIVLNDIEDNLTHCLSHIRGALASGFGVYYGNTEPGRSRKHFLYPDVYHGDIYHGDNVYVPIRQKVNSSHRFCENFFLDQPDQELVGRIHAGELTQNNIKQTNLYQFFLYLTREVATKLKQQCQIFAKVYHAIILCVKSVCSSILLLLSYLTYSRAHTAQEELMKKLFLYHFLLRRSNCLEAAGQESIIILRTKEGKNNLDIIQKRSEFKHHAFFYGMWPFFYFWINHAPPPTYPSSPGVYTYVLNTHTAQEELANKNMYIATLEEQSSYQIKQCYCAHNILIFQNNFNFNWHI